MYALASVLRSNENIHVVKQMSRGQRMKGLCCVSDHAEDSGVRLETSRATEGLLSTRTFEYLV